MPTARWRVPPSLSTGLVFLGCWGIDSYHASEEGGALPKKKYDKDQIITILKKTG